MRRASKYALIVAACCLIQFLHGAGSLSLFAAPEYALQFDGVDDRVTFGAAPTLGAQTFTLEVWFKKTGAGTTTTTGGGGLTTAIPLLTKGRGQAEASNVDMNYFLGIETPTRVLAADFEDMHNGGNHPVRGRTVISDNIWYHAAATYDGTTWRLYLNGELEAESVVPAPLNPNQRVPRFDSIQHAGLGTAMTSDPGTPAGFFRGHMDEARIWNVARSQADIQGTMTQPLFAAQPNLIGRWGLDEGTGTTAVNSAGAPNGTLASTNPILPVWIAGGSGFVAGAQPGNEALRLAVSGDYVALGPATATLGAAQFTVETWFKREAAGLTTGTGAITAVPLVTKGRGEEDNSNKDMNYFLGIDTTGVLAADFEDAPNGAIMGGANHPIKGLTVPGSGWNHAAVTYDGTALQLYLNGFPDGPPVFAGTMPRADSIQHAALGSALNAAGLPTGFFAGSLDETRIWNYARSAAQITATVNLEVSNAPGLLARWSFNEGSGRVVDSTGRLMPFGPPQFPSTGTVAAEFKGGVLQGTGWSWVPRGNPTLSPAPVNLAPVVLAGADQTVTLPATATLSGSVVDPDGPTVGPVQWTKTSGPGAVVFANPASLNTTSTFSAVGTYVLTLTASDGEASGTDSLTVVATGVADPALTPKFAVDFGGTNAYVALGQAPGLGAATFTLEAWIKREGTGIATGTGNLGITAIPLVTKGMAQSDGSNLDMNYFLGIDSATGVLAADFEEGVGGTGPLGLNHPVMGSTVILNNVWYHVAASYDGNKWQLFVNGILDRELVVGQPVRADSIQHAAIGTALGSGGVVGSGTQGFFNGVMDEVRIWTGARTQTQIQEGMAGEIMSAPGLLGRWGLNEGSGGAGTAVADSSGSGNNGVLNGAFTWVPGVPFVAFNRAPNAPALNAPTDDATGVASPATLDVSVSDPEADPLTVTYFGRRKVAVAAPDFTFLTIPDTQHYVDDEARAATFTQQTNWIVANTARLNIAFTSHLGDIVENQDAVPAEWVRADQSMDVLDLNNIPYGVSPGNHDQNPAGVATLFDQYFHPSRFDGRPWYRGYLGSSPLDTTNRLNKDNYEFFSAGGRDFLIIHIEHDWPGYAVTWADRIIKENPNRLVILSTHLFLNTSNLRPTTTQFRGANGTSAEAVWQQIIKPNCNVFMVVNGHYPGEGRRTDLNDCGQPVHQVLMDYQSRINGGDGWLRYFTFKPSENKIYAYTYSPKLSQFEVDADSQFVLDYNLTTPFQVISTNNNVPSGSSTTALWSGLQANAEYEWYVTINDGRSTTTGPVWSFTSAPPPNTAPVAVNDSATTAEDTAVSGNVLTNDTDADAGTALTATLGATPTNGTVTLSSDGSFTYTPNADFNGTDSFTYTASDDTAVSNVATVTITVTSVNDGPTASDDTATTDEDTAATVAVLANDADADGGTLTVSSVTTPANGTAAINADGTITYAPAANFNGADSFTYTIGDSQGGSATATVSVTVTSVNDAPTAGDDAAATAEDTAATIAVLANDADADGGTLTVSSVTTPANGTAAINADGTITYAPAANFNGADSFTYTIGDSQGGSATATVSVTVTSVNDAPTAGDDAAATAEDTAATIAVLANDADADGGTLTVSSVTTPANGTAAINADGTITYAPAANFNGADSFTYTIGDSQGGSATATVSVTVTSVNDGPTAADDSATTAEDTAATIAVLANDADADGGTLTVSSVTTPANGTAVINADGTITYAPAANFNGADSFTYTIGDSQGGSATATVSVTVTSVNDGPTAADDSAATAEDTAATIAVLANDADADGGTLTVSSVTTPANGTAVINADGTITYAPAANFNGADSFTYTIGDSQGGSATATVSVTVTSVNDGPTAADDAAATAEDTAATIAVLANDADADGGTLTVSSVTTPANGTAVINADGTITYAPAANFNGADSFTYTIGDSQGGSATATVSVTVTSVNDGPTAADDAAATAEDTAATIAVLANDADADGGTLTVSSVTTPANGTAVINADGTITYAPAANFHGADSFTYTIGDSQGGSATATVSVTVTSVNDAPTAVNDAATTAENTATTIAVLANDTDVESDSLSVSSVTMPAHGTATINAGGTITYAPAANYSGADSFSYTVSDGNGGTATASVSVTVTDVNHAPVAVNDSATTVEDEAVTIHVLANDTDADGGTLTAELVSGPGHGSVTLNPNGSFRYTPAADFSGADSFRYKARDGSSLDSNVATVTVVIDAENDAPVAANDSYSTGEDQVLNVAAPGVLGNDTDIDGGTLRPVLISGPSHGSVTLNANGSFSYTPAASFSGTDSFTYEANDGSDDSNPATVSIAVSPVNDAPVADSDSVTTQSGTPVSITMEADDAEGSPLTYRIVRNPSNGTLTGTGKTRTYTPRTGFTGSDSFTFVANDGVADSNVATVSITVTSKTNQPPVADNKSVQTNEDTRVTVTLQGDDPEGKSLKFRVISGPKHGDLTGQAPYLKYTPDPNYHGSDSFTFRVSDGKADSNLAKVSIIVKPVNDAPEAKDFSIQKSGPGPVSGFLRGTDVDGDTLRFRIVRGPARGKVTVDAKTGKFVYTPPSGNKRIDVTFRYVVNDGTLDSDRGLVRIDYCNGRHNGHDRDHDRDDDDRYDHHDRDDHDWDWGWGRDNDRDRR